MFEALSFADIAGQHAELLPARTVLTTHGYGDDGGNGGDGGDYNTGGEGGEGGDGGDAAALIIEPHSYGDSEQENVAIAAGGDGGDANGGDVHADGGHGGDGGDDVKK